MSVEATYRLTDSLTWVGPWTTDLTDTAERAFVEADRSAPIDPTKCAIRAVILAVQEYERTATSASSVLPEEES